MQPLERFVARDQPYLEVADNAPGAGLSLNTAFTISTLH